MLTLILPSIPEEGSKLYKCKRCQEWFATLRKVRYCSPICRRKAWRGVKLAPRLCAFCHNEFPPRNPLHIYCSTKCRAIILEARKAERMEMARGKLLTTFNEEGNLP